MTVKVSTLSRVDERIDEAPGSVYVYPRSVIQDRGYQNLGDLLQVVPGFTVFHRDLDFVVGVRGLNANDNDKISLLINGQNLNGPHEQDFSLNGPINLNAVERAEVVVGPSSLLQPANTLAATVNLITRDVEGVELVSSIGNDLYYSETLMAGHHWAADRFVSFAFTAESERGFNAWEPDFQPGLAGRDITGQLDSPSFFTILKGQYGELFAQAIAYKSRWPELHIDNNPRNDGEMGEQFYSLFLKADHPFDSNLTGVFRAEVTRKEQTRLGTGGPVTNAEQQSVKQIYYSGEVGLRYTGIEHHLLQGGVQSYYDHNFDTFFLYNDQTHVPPINIPATPLLKRDDYDIGFYVDDEWRVSEQWKLIGGVRVDHSTRLEGNRWFPGARAAIIYEPTKTWVSKLVYNRSIRLPSSFEALNDVWGAQHAGSPFDPPFAQTLNPPNEPETLSTVEWDNVLYLGSVRLGANIYHEELQDFISFFNPHANGGNFRGNGVELNAQAPLQPGVKLWANASWNDSKLDLFNPALFGANPQGAGSVETFHAYVNQHGRMIGSPEYTANLGLDLEITRNLRLSPSVRYFTNQAAVSFHPNSLGGPSYDTVNNQFYLDATLTWAHIAGKDMDLRLSGYNLLGNRSAVASQQQADTYRPRGISFIASLDVRF